MNKIRYVILMSIVTLLSVSASACLKKQTCLSRSLDGRMMPYDFCREEPFVVPDSLTVVNVGYVARHGARYMTSEKKFIHILEALRREERKRNLTDRGRDFLELLDTVLLCSDGRWGLLSDVGAMEQHRLASEMDSILPGFFRHRDVTAVATYVPRVIRTMQDFTYRLAVLNPDMNLTASEGPEWNTLLRFFATDSIYRSYIRNGPWRERYDRECRREVPVRPAGALFVRVPADDDTMRGYTQEMYEVLSSLSAIGMAAPAREYMTEKEYASCWRMSDYQQYLTRALPATDYGMAEAVRPLLQTFADNLFGTPGHSPSAVFYFGHAETILPLLCVMGFPEDSDSEDNICETWRNYELAPLGANLLVVSATTADGHEYVAFRLNGRNVQTVPDAGQWVSKEDLLLWWGIRMSVLTNGNQ